MKPLVFSAQDAKEYLDLIDDVAWREIKDRASPESVARLKEIMGM
jgi:hypothetical protein